VSDGNKNVAVENGGLGVAHTFNCLLTSSFSCRIVNVWNSLPQHVVEASNTNIFKTRLGKFWSDRDCKYLWKANLYGSGSRSEVLCNYDDVAN